MNAPERMSHADRRERRRQIAEAMRSGGDVGEVARQFSVSISAVRDACREWNVLIQPPRPQQSAAPAA
jgi:transposase-like protein